MFLTGINHIRRVSNTNLTESNAIFLLIIYEMNWTVMETK